MKKLKYIYFVLCCMVGFTACDDTMDHDVAQISAPKMISCTPGEGTQVRSGNTTVKVLYDMNIFFASEDASKIQIDNGGSVVSADVVGVSDTLTVVARFPERGTTYTMTIPEGLVTGPNGIAVPAATLQFTTRSLDNTPVMAATPEALAVYDYLHENFEVNTLSAAMARDGLNETEDDNNKASWNTLEAELVNTWTGKYPAMNCFDYIHLAYSSSDGGAWINYGDITPVQTWWNNGGLVLAMWHWNVPKTWEDKDANLDNYTSTREETQFDADKACTEGTSENGLVQEDLAKIAGYLKQLKNANIPVIWRPLHEAAGGWFWWGKNADSFKALWKYMFDYFKEQGLDNLIWVWTSETDDLEWYPGDEYVDIIGRDLYGNATDDCAAQYQSLATDYGTKMVALSECGQASDGSGTLIGKLSEQWNAGARWLWFMPWYDASETDTPTDHNDEAWWKDAMSQDYVISRDELPNFRNGN